MTRREFGIVLCIILLAAFFRFYHFSETPGLYPDEAMNGNNAREAMVTGNYKVFYPENNGREGLFMNIQSISLQLFGRNEPWVLRLPSPFIGVLTVLGFFLMLWEIGVLTQIPHRFQLAAFGAFFMATSVWHIIFSRIGFRAIMAPFFIIWAVFFFILAFRKFNFRYALLSGVFLGLGAYSYIAYRLIPFVLLIFVSIYRKRRGFWHIAFGAVLTAFLVALPLLAYFGAHPTDFMGRTSQVSVFSSPHPLSDFAKNIGLTLAMFNFHGDTNGRQNLIGYPELSIIVGIFFLVGIILAIGRRTFFHGFIALWFVLALLPVVISNEGIPHALRSVLLIPPALMFAADGAVFLYEKLKHRLILAHYKTAFLIIVGLAISLEAYIAYFGVWIKSPVTADSFNAGYVAIGREINQLPPEEDKYVVVRRGGVDVRGVPMPAQTVMFITDSFLPQIRKQKHIHYLLPAEYEAEKEAIGTAPTFFLD